jgi:hypothetical protein
MATTTYRFRDNEGVYYGSQYAEVGLRRPTATGPQYRLVRTTTDDSGKETKRWSGWVPETELSAYSEASDLSRLICQ